MKATIWGCRGSVASPGPDTVRYGGNTPCVEVRLDDGTVIVLDAGTGIRALGAKLAADPPARIDLLLSHLHLDHLQGLGFFRPLFMKGLEIHLWGPRSPWTASGRGSRATSLPRSSRCSCRTCRRWSACTTSPRSPGRSAANRRRRPRLTPGADAGLPHRRGRPLAHLHPRP
jgi:ribonuclease BN (tRNA processing enzyme)